MSDGGFKGHQGDIAPATSDPCSKQKTPSSDFPTVRREQGGLRYLLVIDVEATCEQDRDDFPHEIIELPAVLLDLDSLTTIDHFHTFIRPTENRQLSAFCTARHCTIKTTMLCPHE